MIKNTPYLGKYVKHRDGKIYENRGYHRPTETVDISSLSGSPVLTVPRSDLKGPITANEELELLNLYPSIEI
jgi:hypothetical protein